uniref:Putative LRR receptor-like serine/threonine-protein kinase MRH1 n=2 Tax=Anthurium amnicola TaxID=1678845 RepID=A0A1D1YB95_9ARAE
MLEILDLRGNNLTGEIPKEIGEMLSLKQLLLCNNSFHGAMPSHLDKLNMLCELQVDKCPLLDAEVGVSFLNRKLGHCLWQSGLRKLKKANFFMIPLKGQFLGFLEMFKFRDGTLRDSGKEYGHLEPYFMENEHQYVNPARRRLLQEANNLPAVASTIELGQKVVVVPSTGSGSFPAVPFSKGGNVENIDAEPGVPVTSPNSIPSARSAAKPMNSLEREPRGIGRTWAYVLVLPGAAFLVTIAVGMLVMFRAHASTAIGPWKTGLSGQLQKAFIAGVPKLNRAELEAACEDFSNIIQTFPDCTVFKGTLSSGVEIAVVSTAIASSKGWSKSSEMLFLKKIDSLSRVNHKNFVNLLGYCEENEPFMRMMVFEYAPNGTLFEHLHVKELEHLDWGVRMRIIMGVAYCLQYMHHELNPPVVHPSLRSNAIFLTDDYAAKIAEIGFWKEVAAKGKLSGEDDNSFSESLSTHPESNIYDFGLLLLEIISGKHPYSEEQGSVGSWAAEYLNDKRSISYMIDPTLKSFKNNELDIVCEAIQDCIHPDPKRRPTMKEVTTKLREVIMISPESATPRLSPLWWAELEILTVEAS